MRFRAFLIGCSILSAPLLSAGLEIPTDFSQTNKPATIKVLIEKQKDKILLEAKGRHFIYHPSNEHLISQESTSTKNWVTTAHNGLKWGQLFPGTFQIRIVPPIRRPRFSSTGSNSGDASKSMTSRGNYSSSTRSISNAI